MKIFSQGEKKLWPRRTCEKLCASRRAGELRYTFIEDMAGAYESGRGPGDLPRRRLDRGCPTAPCPPAILVPFPHAVDDHQTANAIFSPTPVQLFCCRRMNLSAEKLACCAR